MGPLERRKQKIAENAVAYLEPGEEVRSVAMVQTRVPAWLTALAGFMAKVHAIVATDSNLYVLSISSASVSKVTGVVLKQPHGQVTAELTGGAVTLGGVRYYILLGARNDVEEALRLSGAQAPPAPAATG